MQLSVVAPAVERHAKSVEHGESLAAGRQPKKPFGARGWMMRLRHVGRGVPAVGVADAAEVSPRRPVGQKHLFHCRAQGQIGEPDDGSAAAHACAVEPRSRHRRDALHELRLANRRLRAALLPVHGTALDEHRVDDVVPRAADVLHQVVGEIAQLHPGFRRHLRAGPAVPEVVVRIDDRLLRVDRVFRRTGEPTLQVLPGYVSRQFGHRMSQHGCVHE